MSDGLKFPKKKKAPPRLTPAKVQLILNKAIVRRDRYCVMDGEHSEKLEASHFFTVGANGSMRFYPPNVHCQCHKHHSEYHNDSAIPYVLWMESNIDEMEYMQKNRKKTLHYSQSMLYSIKEMSERDDLDGIQVLIESMLEGA